MKNYFLGDLSTVVDHSFIEPLSSLKMSLWSNLGWEATKKTKEAKGVFVLLAFEGQLISFKIGIIRTEIFLTKFIMHLRLKGLVTSEIFSFIAKFHSDGVFKIMDERHNLRDRFRIQPVPYVNKPKHSFTESKLSL